MSSLRSVAAALSAVPAPSTPLGPFEDSAVTWTGFVTLGAFVGLVVFALVVAGPPARRIGSETLAGVTTRSVRVAAVLGVLSVPAVLSEVAHSSSKSGGFDYGAAWDTVYDGTNAGRLLGLEVTLALVGAALVAPLTVRMVAASRARNWLLTAGLTTGAVALGCLKFPAVVPPLQSEKSFETFVWMLHLLGGAIWQGGLQGLLLLVIPGAIAATDRAAFWSSTIRRFSAVAMSSVAALLLSGLFLYWEHVDGPSQLFTTMYGRVLGVKILIFGTLLLLGIANQFWLHPRIEALRASGDDRPLRTLLVREFRIVVSVELLLVLTVLFVAPFLSGSARNQAFQADAAKHATSATTTKLPKIPAKEVSGSTWAWGIAETFVVIAIMIGGYYLSGYLVRRRAGAAVPAVPRTPSLAGEN